MLLYEDGLDKNWEEGVQSNWRISHNNDTEKVSPYAILRLNRSFVSDNVCDKDTNESKQSHISLQCKKYSVNNKRVVAKMPLHLFRRCLVNHFDIRFKRNDIIWPSRCKK